MKATRRKISPARAIQQPAAFEQIDVSALIDVGFLLLIFFLVTSSIRKAETGLPTSLAGRPTPAAATPLTLELRAARDGTVTVDERVVEEAPGRRSMPAVVDELKTAKALADAAGDAILVVLDADDELQHQRFADVLNALRAAEIENVTFKETQ